MKSLLQLPLALATLSLSLTASAGPFSPEEIQNLRSQGPAGLKTALRAFDDYSRSTATESSVQPTPPQEWRNAIDTVAGQRHAIWSRLYWYDNINDALLASQQNGKPVLILRMLGDLTEEFSCANSRLFRTLLYTDDSVKQRLRENFTLCWSSERPVPKVMIDFRDGRTLRTTITGNSAHLLLNPQGRVIDGLPGMHTPEAFANWLDETRKLYLATQKAGRGRDYLTFWHETRNDEMLASWKNLRAAAAQQTKHPTLAAWATAAPNVDQWRDIPLAWTWLADWQPNKTPTLFHILKSPEVSTHLVRTLMRKPTAQEAMLRTVSKRAIEDPVLGRLREAQRSTRADTLMNYYVLTPQVRQIIIDNGPLPVEAFTRELYSTVFLTPRNDPWMGFSKDSVFTGLENDGRIETAEAQ